MAKDTSKDQNQGQQQKSQDIKFKAIAIRIAVKEAFRAEFTPSIPKAPSSLNAQDTYKVLTKKAGDKYNELAGQGKLPPFPIDQLDDKVVIEFETFFDIKELKTDRNIKINNITEKYNAYYYDQIEPNKDYKRIGAGLITVSRMVEMMANLKPENNIPNISKQGVKNFRITKLKDLSEDVLDIITNHLDDKAA